MKAGEIRLRWDARGELDIKTSLPVASSENKKLAIRVLLDAAKALLEAGTPLEVPVGNLPVRILGGG